MAKTCDHTSVGMFVWHNDTLLLIERGKEPFGFAVPAGHVDGDSSFEEAAMRELREEVGLDTKKIALIAEGRRENPCRRVDGSWHYWKIYRIEAEGDLVRSLDETKQARFYTKVEIILLAQKTERYVKGKMTEEEWQKSPGLEPVMYDWFKQLSII